MTSGVRCLITGAGGFVGSCLARRLVETGARVTLLARPGTDLWRLKDVEAPIVRTDILDAAAVKRAVDEARPEIVYHLAAHGGYSSQKDARRILETNVVGTLNLLEATSGCRLFVHAGSSSEYGFKKEPMRETDRLEPNSAYAVGKAAATHLCSLAGRTTLRLFSVYGPYEEPSRFIPTLIRRALRNEPIDLVPPDTARDFVHVDDVVDAFMRVATPGVFNIGSGVPSTIADAVRIVMELTGSKSELRWQAMKSRDWDTTTWVGSIEKAGTGFGWKPRTSLREGLEKMLRS